MSLNNGMLSQIIIKGFKSIKQCDIKFGKTNVLIGCNGAGKSNFISAFSLLQDILLKNLQLSVARSGLNSMLYLGRKHTDEICFEAFFGDNSYGFELTATDDNRLVFKKEFLGTPVNPDNEPIISREGASSLIKKDFANGNSESFWDNELNKTISTNVISILEKQNWRVYHFHDTGRSSKIKQEHNVSNNKLLMPDAGNLAAFLYRLKNSYTKSYNEIIKTIQLIAPYFSDFVLEPEELNPEQIILKWSQKGCDDVFNASQLSDGTLRFICLATLLLQPEELRPATIILDEPELGLHPFAITILSELIKGLSDETQAIISTQSVELLNEFDVEDIIVVDRGENGSEFKRLNRDELIEWLDEDYSLGELWQKNLLGGRFSR